MEQFIVFEGVDEVLVVSSAHVNDFIKEWFLEGERSLDEYDTYLVDGNKGFSVTTRVHMNNDDRKDYDVTDLLPNAVREALIEKGLLTDE